ncbi:NAD(P) transhydrogenase subunit alpha [Proteiniphilum sp. UBA5384]|uniref:NAD(P) transhydrogenase subunit alpha n=1 Tax=Proteiniphilum sp. UBA5384 TaxID=1947279 RepID=UPI0025F25562|nr:NAD(P) transhydrogenase subunit alpha [Proteiniphilum sp. UBA5384]
MNPVILVLVFIVASVVGYLIIRNVPSLLHTPLMSGMNALAGIIILGALVVVGLSDSEATGARLAGQVLGGLAVIGSIVNVVGGFGVTHRMLKMFDKKKKSGKS